MERTTLTTPPLLLPPAIALRQLNVPIEVVDEERGYVREDTVTVLLQGQLLRLQLDEHLLRHLLQLLFGSLQGLVIAMTTEELTRQ